MADWIGGESARGSAFLRIGIGGAQIFTAVLVTVLATSSAQPGYLSIDCGGVLGNFTDSLNMTWVADNGTYIKTGESLQMATFSNSTVGYERVLETFRYFPQGRDKYCYELPTTPNNSYLVRATFFMYPAVWNARLPVQFGVSIDATNWFTFTSNEPVADDSIVYASQEGIFHTSNELINFCLLPGIGEPFISSLELRQLDPTMYSYGGSELQYLSLLFRYNIGAKASLSHVRYPDDPYDRIWTTLDDESNALLPNVSRSSPLDKETRADVFFVPPKVMEDGWLFTYPLNWVSASLYPSDPQIYLPQGDYAYTAVYCEHLNASDSEVYTVYVALDGFDPTPMNFTNHATSRHNPNFILSSNYLSFTMNLTAGVTLEDGPTLNAAEVYSQSSFNFSSTNTADDQAVTAVKNSLNLTDWQGDSCTPVPHNWLDCSLDSATFQPIIQPCSSDRNSVTECVVQEGFLRSTYYVVSVQLSDLPRSGFQLLTNSTDVVLSSLTNLSITNSGVDSTTFKYFLSSFSNATRLFLLDFSNNAIDTPPNWSVMESLLSLNLAHNNLTDLSISSEAPLPETLKELNLSYNGITSLPPVWQTAYNSLVMLDLSHNQIQADISSLEQLVQMNGGVLQELNVSHNQFFGTFSGSSVFTQVPNLTMADFSENSIQGTLNLSEWYNALTRASSGKVKPELDTTTQVTAQLFSFVNNNITDIVPNANEIASVENILKSQQGGVLLGGNPYCNGAKSFTQRYLCRSSVNDVVENGKKSNKWVLILSICSGIIIFLLLCSIFAILWRLWKQVKSLRKIQRALADRKVQPPFYEYHDLRSATLDFNKDQKLGHGSFGVVFKGVMADGTLLAVKKIFNSQTLQALDDFLNEVVIITGIKHRNLVQLKGCCIRDKQRMLVYEYAERGNLAEALWGSKAHGGLDWEQRFDICVGVARGLAYLHEELYPSIIHRDIKPANILLDKNFKPKIADFGLARYYSEEASDVDSTEIAGTMGYLAPEYAMHGYLSDKVDVYSYGIVILEIVCGRKCIDSSLPLHEKFLKDWVCDQIRNDKVLEILQPEIRCSCDLSEVMCAIKIGLLCIQHRPEMRPSMSQVVTMLSGTRDLENFMVKSSSNQSSIQDLVRFIRGDVNYPTLRRLAEDSTIYPLASLDSQTSSSVTSWRQHTQTSIELSSINGK